jgi:two-component system NtrC family sensor kinase
MKRILSLSLGGRLQNVLIASFALVAILTGSLITVVLSRVINDYLASAQADRVARDMDIANGFYQQKWNETLGVSQLIALDAQSVEGLPAAIRGDSAAIQAIDRLISRAIAAPTLTGRRVIIVLDKSGRVVIGRSLADGEQISAPFTEGDWSQLPSVALALSSNSPATGTEVIPSTLLTQANLYQQTRILFTDAGGNGSIPFNPSEGLASLALAGTYPIQDETGHRIGAVVTAYLFNNEFSLVDYAHDVAGIDVMTIFLGDLRVSTNILDEMGNRAVGTRVSQEVYQTVLVQGKDYIGRSSAAGSWYIGRYEPLRDCQGVIVGILYVGVHESIFNTLVHSFNNQVVIIALVCIVIAGIIALPITRLISNPINQLVAANRRLAKGDMNVRVEARGQGELAMLGSSFNNMVETLQETEKELLRQEKLASMGQMAAGVAHELNNPLGTILLYADIVGQEMPEGDARLEDLKMIIDETQRCKLIVANLLNFARQQQLSAQEIDLSALLEEVITKVTERPRFKDIAIVRQFGSEPLLLQADGAQLQQVFINLLNNSADAMENSGTITLSARQVDVSTVEILVSDTGCGIPPENLKKVFTPFFTTKPADRGTGLGLSIVYGIIKAHSGQITVQSQVGQGTTFRITLPVRRAAAQGSPTAQPADLIG